MSWNQLHATKPFTSLLFIALACALLTLWPDPAFSRPLGFGLLGAVLIAYVIEEFLWSQRSAGQSCRHCGTSASLQDTVCPGCKMPLERDVLSGGHESSEVDRVEDSPVSSGGEGLSEEVRKLAADPRRKIEAIRVYREETGSSLLDAKVAIEAYQRSLRSK